MTFLYRPDTLPVDILFHLAGKKGPEAPVVAHSIRRDRRTWYDRTGW